MKNWQIEDHSRISGNTFVNCRFMQITDLNKNLDKIYCNAYKINV